MGRGRASVSPLNVHHCAVPKEHHPVSRVNQMAQCSWAGGSCWGAGGVLWPHCYAVFVPLAVDEQNKQTQAYQAAAVPSKKDSSEELNREEERLCKAPMRHAASFRVGFEGSNGVGSLSSHLQPTPQALAGRR